MREDYRPFGAYRLFLAWLVLTSHANSYLPEWVGQLALGNIGVFSFFVLSGFVIIEACDRFYRGVPHRFFLNRFLRIYPTYWGACILAVAIYAAQGHPEMSGSAMEVAANIGIAYIPPGTFMWISIAWAVAIELRFYFIAGVVMWLAQRNPAFATPLLGIAGCAALVFYFVAHASGYQILGTFRHAPYFVLGAAGYFAIAYASRPARLLGIVAALMSAHSFWNYNAAAPALLELKLLMFAFSVIALFTLALANIPAGVVRNDKKLGDFSYPLYLVHWPIIYLVETIVNPHGMFGYFLAALLSIVFSTLIVFCIDRPLMSLRDRVRRLRLYV